MPTRKISEIHQIARPSCSHREHDPPKHMLLKNGIYEHTCPSCEAIQVFVVNRPGL